MSQRKPLSNLLDLPAEILEHIFIHVTPQDICRLESVSHAVRQQASTDYIWRTLTKSEESPAGLKKEEYQESRTLKYTILTVRCSKLPGSTALNDFKFNQEDMANLLKNASKNPEDCYWASILEFTKLENRIFTNAKRGIECLIEERDKESTHRHNGMLLFLIKYQEMDRKIKILACRGPLENDLIAFNEPVILDISAIKDFPSMKPAVTAIKTIELPSESSDTSSQQINLASGPSKSLSVALTQTSFKQLKADNTDVQPKPKKEFRKPVDDIPNASGSGSCRIA